MLIGLLILTLLPSQREKSNQSTTVEQLYFPQTPTLEQVFSDDHSWIATLSGERRRTIIATGDIIPARTVNFKIVARDDFTWPYQKTTDVLKNADITFINLETPLLKDCPVTREGMVFCGNAQHVEGLVFAGVDIASLANNHAGNHSEKGVNETTSILTQHGIAVMGTDKNPITVKNIRGVRFAFLGFNDITSPQPGVLDVDEKLIRQEIARAKTMADVVIVTYHWGGEYRAQPDDRQKYLGHFTINAGADFVIGNHPHWIQPIEFYQGKLITYAHGNFVFDQMWSEETKKGVVGKYTFYGGTLIDAEYFPIYIKDYDGQPIFLEGDEKQKILDNMKKESGKLNKFSISEHQTENELYYR